MHWLNGTMPEWREANSQRKNYQLTHSLLRVIRNGLECKRIVDEVIDDCGSNINLRNSIEESRLAAETCIDEAQKKRIVDKGLVQLKRYFILIVFQSFLNQTAPESPQKMTKFSVWYSKHPELESIRQELDATGILGLTPVEDLVPGDGLALTNEVRDVVNGRQGAVVAQGTIIKVFLERRDFHSTTCFQAVKRCPFQKKLKVRYIFTQSEGAPNFRRLSLFAIRQQSPTMGSVDMLNMSQSGM